jgi:hypothetical protein
MRLDQAFRSKNGEIIESDVILHHNHLRSYRNRYLLETGAANPSANLKYQ